jgi:hypothetical protein
MGLFFNFPWRSTSSSESLFFTTEADIVFAEMIARAALIRTLRQMGTSARSRSNLNSLRTPTGSHLQTTNTRCASHVPHARWMSSKTLADERIEDITELYATAQDGPPSSSSAYINAAR